MRPCWPTIGNGTRTAIHAAYTGGRAGACLIAGQDSTAPKAHPARTSPGAKLHHKAFPSAGHHTQAKARDAFVRQEELRRLRLDSVDDALVSFGIARSCEDLWLASTVGISFGQSTNTLKLSNKMKRCAEGRAVDLPDGTAAVFVMSNL